MMNKIMAKIMDIVNTYFKLIIIVCVILYLMIYYQSTLNHRYQYIKVDFKDCHEIVFDSSTGDMFGRVEYRDFSRWERKTPVQNLSYSIKNIW